MTLIELRFFLHPRTSGDGPGLVRPSLIRDCLPGLRMCFSKRRHCVTPRVLLVAGWAWLTAGDCCRRSAQGPKRHCGNGTLTEGEMRGEAGCQKLPGGASAGDRAPVGRQSALQTPTHRAGPEMKPELRALPRKPQHDNPRRAPPSHMGTAIPRGTKMPRCSGHGGGACDDRAIGRGGRLAVGRLHHRRHLRTNKQTSGGFRVKAKRSGAAADRAWLRSCMRHWQTGR